MKQSNDLAKYISDFLGNYLANERGVSTNTIKSYTYTFILFINFMKTAKKTNIECLSFRNFTRDVVVEFLDWLQKERGCSNATRNQRLAAMSSFIKYAEYIDPVNLYECQQILSIPVKKTGDRIISHLTEDGIKLLLKQVDATANRGLRDLALLSLMYESGARVQEIVDLSPSSLLIASKPYRVELHGKGNKYRVVPLPESQVRILLQYMEQDGLLNRENVQKPLFPNPWNQKMTRNGINNILMKYVKKAKEENEILIPDGISCHSIRHSKALGLLDSKVELIHIRDFLGHKSVTTTEIYARMSPKYTFDAVKNAYKNIAPNEIPVWEGNDKILNMLKEFLK
jgi:site-specific recombinase XerD